MIRLECRECRRGPSDLVNWPTSVGCYQCPICFSFRLLIHQISVGVMTWGNPNPKQIDAETMRGIMESIVRYPDERET